MAGWRWALVLSLTITCSGYAQTSVVYRYLDKEGKTVITDQPPKGVPFERIERDPATNVIESPRKEARKSGPENSVDARILQRTRLRDQLRSEVDAARARLAAAREALASGQDPKEGEWQPTITAPDNGGKPNANGVITGRGGRVVCRVESSGRVLCPAVPVPSEAYHERIAALEAVVNDAEEAVRAAENNYRRNAPD